MKAIETTYKGYKFRSRLEARWAVFFGALGIAWEYEREGYDLEGEWYLPDFWLPEQQCWIEIKGQKPTKAEREKAILLAFLSDHPAYIFHGEIWLPGLDDTEQRIGDISPRPKGAECYSPEGANMIGIDTTTKCNIKCSHDESEYGCPYMHTVGNRGEEGKLVRAFYIADLRYSCGERCNLHLTPEGILQFLHRAPHGDGQEILQIPRCIEQYRDEFTAFFQRFSHNWKSPDRSVNEAACISPPAYGRMHCAPAEQA